MSNRSLILCMALAVVASGALMTRHELHKRAWHREGRRRLLPFGAFKPSGRSDSVPL